MGQDSTRTTGRLTSSILVAAVLLLGLFPGVVHGACYGGRCPTGEDTGESKVDVRISIAIEPAGAGTVDVDGEELEEDSFRVTQGDTVTLEADPSRGYEFVGWSGSITSTQNPLVTPFYNNKSITAHFAPEKEKESKSSSGLSIVIPNGTAAREPEGGEVTGVTVQTARKHDTPDSMVIVSDVYDLGPEGATFEPALPLALPFDQDELPEGVDPSGLVIAWFDEDSDEWVALESSVDEDAGAVDALVAHFTDFCIMAPRPMAPAVMSPTGSVPGFSLSGLDVAPVEPRVGETVNITVVASYDGDAIEGGTVVTLTVDGAAVDSQEVLIPSGEIEHVVFTYVPTSDAAHTIDVNGLQGVFEVAPGEPSEALSEAVALAESDSFNLPDVSLPSLPATSGLTDLHGFDFAGHWWWALMAGLGLLTLIVALPLLRRRILRMRYDI
jgi:hypothetical protein